MSNGLDTAITVALITAIASLIVGLIAGGIAYYNGGVKAAESQFDIEAFKSEVNNDLEHLKATLLHRQLISSTQWLVGS
jgi:hypothetical protein